MNVIKKFLGWLRRALLSNFWLKVLSLVLAIALWSFVLTNDTTITRERVLSNLYINTTNQSTLDSRDLAITEALSEILPQVRVAVEVTKSDYYRVTSNNVRVELDLSRIRETGEQTIPLTASTVYGTVTGIYPDSVTLNVDELEQRNVQVEVVLDGADEDNFWYSSPTSNPSILTVSGPASQVEQITSARAVMDLSGVDTVGSITRAVSFTLMNDDQRAVSFPAVSTTTSSVITSVDAYPIQNIPVETDLAKVITGTVAQGYQIDAVEVQPSEIAVAGAQRFLDSLDTVQIYSINVNDMSETTTKTTRVNRQSDMKYLSTEEVLVTIRISERQISRTFDSMTPELTGLAEGLTATRSRDFTVTVTGPYTQISALSRGDVQLYVDVTGLPEGEYELPVYCQVDSDADLDINIEPATIKVAIQ